MSQNGPWPGFLWSGAVPSVGGNRGFLPSGRSLIRRCCADLVSVFVVAVGGRGGRAGLDTAGTCQDGGGAGGVSVVRHVDAAGACLSSAAAGGRSGGGPGPGGGPAGPASGVSERDLCPARVPGPGAQSHAVVGEAPGTADKLDLPTVRNFVQSSRLDLDAVVA
ncbi:MAG: hypothetical protein QG608_1905 [Actinomycetota bacterium]|nr:hypothetical protein [Actinomycetota bacterium]